MRAAEEYRSTERTTGVQPRKKRRKLFGPRRPAFLERLSTAPASCCGAGSARRSTRSGCPWTMTRSLTTSGSCVSAKSHFPLPQLSCVSAGHHQQHVVSRRWRGGPHTKTTRFPLTSFVFDYCRQTTIPSGERTSGRAHPPPTPRRRRPRRRRSPRGGPSHRRPPPDPPPPGTVKQ